VAIIQPKDKTPPQLQAAQRRRARSRVNIDRS